MTATGNGEQPQIIVKLDASGTPLLARLIRKSCIDLGLQVGQNVFAQMKAMTIER